MKKFVKEFKEFAMQGNVIDMAVGVVIGGAFGKIVASLVADIFTPLISLLTGSANFVDLKWVIKPAVGETPAVVMSYGNFLQATIDFIVIALCIFMVIRAMNKFKKAPEVVEEAPAPKSDEVVLLENILEELKKNK
ncbi:large-conductance mechanosensitive channel protein MscL [Erysipelothrix tonsillarum]|uniref:large-conductance mechanosensitive channel protein MscL n=1 Tax=Erysipelothrix tonsillarum TaxID=38402 RepID=UPI000365B83D|nr:large-conductance mechanosensitive channel protein MscL [Erysipelothrix tonsillarum]